MITLTSNLSAYQAARSKWVEPLLLTSSTAPASAPGRAGPGTAAGRPLFCHAVISYAVLTVLLKIHTATAQVSASHPVCLHFSSA